MQIEPLLVPEKLDLDLKIGMNCTVWKFQDFSAIQILREINFEESRSSKTVIFVLFGALNFVNLVKFSLLKVLFLPLFEALNFVDLIYFCIQKVQTFIKIKIHSL